MPNPEYWKARAKESLAESFATADEAEAYLTEVYKKSLIDFCKNYNDLVKPFVKNGVLDTDALRQALNTDASFQYKYFRLQEEIGSISSSLGEIGNKELEKTLETVYIDTFENTTGSIYKLDKQAIEKAVKTPWTNDGREFSERVWKNTDLFQENLRATLSNSITKGESIQKSVKEFKRIYGNTTYNTSRLIRTETLAIHNRASLDSYEELGMEYLEVLAEADACDICADHNGNKVLVSEAEQGVNIPPFHPNCKCCIMPITRKK